MVVVNDNFLEIKTKLVFKKRLEGMRQMTCYPSLGGTFLFLNDNNYDNFDVASSVYRRPSPYFGSPDFRIFEMNKRLQQRSDVS